MLYKKTMENRKVLVNRLQELTGRRAVYTRMPECAFVIDDYKVEKNGTLVVADDADMEPIETLLAEGLIVPYEPDEHEMAEENSQDEEEMVEEAQPEETQTEETQEEVQPEVVQAEDVLGEAQPEEAEEIREEVQQEMTETQPEEAQEEAQPEETREETEEAQPEEVHTEAPQTEVQQIEAPQTEAPQTEAAPASDPGDQHVISLSMTNHSVTSLRNLVNMVYARAGLLSKATGGKFACTEGLVEALESVVTIETLISTISDYHGELKGLEITPEKVAFTGFPQTDDADKVKAFTQLVSLMNKMALTSKRVLARPVVEDNERYIFRIWLIRLGMAGKEYATARKLLLEPLSGNSAFKDKAMEERWKAKRKAAAEEAEQTTEGETAEESTSEVGSPVEPTEDGTEEATEGATEETQADGEAQMESQDTEAPEDGEDTEGSEETPADATAEDSDNHMGIADLLLQDMED